MSELLNLVEFFVAHLVGVMVGGEMYVDSACCVFEVYPK